jgi:hypothetical protein
LVTSVSVVQRWNQAVAVLYSAKIAEIADIDRAQQHGVPPDHSRHHKNEWHDPARDRRQEEDPVGVGRIQHLLAGLQDIVDITPHTLASITSEPLHSRPSRE